MEKRGLDNSGEEAYYKRARLDSSFEEGRGGGPKKESKVLHVRNVDPNTTQDELVSFVSQYGSVIAICFLSKFNQALIEMDSIEAASAVMMHAKSTPVYIRGKEIHFNYSKSQNINVNARQGPSEPVGVSNVLLSTILNPAFPITVDVMHTIMSPYGTVCRIVIFNKNGVQALVEFDNTLSAATAKASLEGKDIYAGSCTLKIEFSKSSKLNVHTNNEKTWDYTNPGLPTALPGMAPGLPPGMMGMGPMGPMGPMGGLPPGAGMGYPQMVFAPNRWATGYYH